MRASGPSNPLVHLHSLNSNQTQDICPGLFFLVAQVILFVLSCTD